MSSDSGAQPPDAEAPNNRQGGNDQPAIGITSESKSHKNPCHPTRRTQHEKPKRDWLDIANFIVLICAFLAAVAAAVEADRLASLTQTAIDHADTSSNTQHLDTIKALTKADVANQTSSQALTDSESEAHIRLRAYLTIAATRSALVIGRPLTSIVTVKAGGQTPAFDVKGHGHTGPKPVELRNGDITIGDAPKNANAISLNPGDTITLPSTTEPINQITFDTFRNGTVTRFYMWGRITYKDVFGCHRWQNYCFRVNDSSGSNPPDVDPCVKYNNAEGPPGECPAN